MCLYPVIFSSLCQLRIELNSFALYFPHGERKKKSLSRFGYVFARAGFVGVRGGVLSNILLPPADKGGNKTRGEPVIVLFISGERFNARIRTALAVVRGGFSAAMCNFVRERSGERKISIDFSLFPIFHMCPFLPRFVVRRSKRAFKLPPPSVAGRRFDSPGASSMLRMDGWMDGWMEGAQVALDRSGGQPTTTSPSVMSLWDIRKLFLAVILLYTYFVSERGFF